jgi:hypothetical protein
MNYDPCKDIKAGYCKKAIKRLSENFAKPQCYSYIEEKQECYQENNYDREWY